MRFNVFRDDMRVLLSHVTRVIQTSQTVDSLQNVLLRVDQDNNLHLGCSDAETTIMARMQLTNVQEAGDVAVGGEKLFQVFTRIGSGIDVFVESEDNQLIVKSPHKTFKLLTIPANHLERLFGYLDEDPELTLEIEANRLLRLIRDTSFAAGNRAARQYLNGVMFDISADSFRSVATDALSMAIYTDADGGQDVGAQNRQVIVPNKALVEMEFMLREHVAQSSEEAPKVALMVNEKRLSLSCGPYRLVTQLIDVQYPDYERVIPMENIENFTCARSLLLDHLDSSLVCAPGNSNAVNFRIADKTLYLTARDEEGNSETGLMPVEAPGVEPEIVAVASTTSDDDDEENLPVTSLEGKEMIFTIDGNRLKEVLNHVTGEQVTIFAPDSTTGAATRANLKIVGQDHQAATYIVTRMRV